MRVELYIVLAREIILKLILLFRLLQQFEIFTSHFSIGGPVTGLAGGTARPAGTFSNGGIDARAHRDLCGRWDCADFKSRMADRQEVELGRFELTPLP